MIIPLHPTRQELPVAFAPFLPEHAIQVPSPFHSSRNGLAPRLIVMHSAESHERAGAARNVASWFQNKSAKVSAHYTVDPADVVQSVDLALAAWHAGKVNPYSIGIELAGKAAQTEGEWLDDDSKATLSRAAGLVGYLCHTYAIPVAMPSDEELRAGASGIVGHVDCTRTFGGTHWDPGPGLPWLQFLLAVRGYVDLLESKA